MQCTSSRSSLTRSSCMHARVSRARQLTHALLGTPHVHMHMHACTPYVHMHSQTSNPRNASYFLNFFVIVGVFPQLSSGWKLKTRA